MSKIKNIFLIGNTGSMKTEICQEISKSSIYQIFNFGNILRTAMLEDTPDAHVIRAYQFLGRTSPFDITSNIFKRTASKLNFNDPFLISSFPLNPNEFHLLRNYTSRAILQNSIFYILETSVEQVKNNLLEKYICNFCGHAIYKKNIENNNILKCNCGENLTEFNGSNYIKRHFFTSYVQLDKIYSELDVSGLDVRKIDIQKVSIQNFVKEILQK